MIPIALLEDTIDKEPVCICNGFFVYYPVMKTVVFCKGSEAMSFSLPDHDAISYKIVNRPSFGVGVHGEEGDPAEQYFCDITQKSLQQVDLVIRVAHPADADLLDIISQCAAEGGANGLINCKQTKK
jgi:hypothetical protein